MPPPSPQYASQMASPSSTRQGSDDPTKHGSSPRLHCVPLSLIAKPHPHPHTPARKRSRSSPMETSEDQIRSRTPRRINRTSLLHAARYEYSPMESFEDEIRIRIPRRINHTSLFHPGRYQSSSI